MNEQSTPVKSKLSVKFKLLAASVAVAAAVALPQLIHLLGGSIGMGSALGEMLLPMHFPILLLGLLVGPQVAVLAGLASPLISFFLTGMPTPAMLTFMMLELGIYGVTAGLLKDYHIPTFSKVLIAQIGGRVIRGAAILTAYYLIGSRAVSPAVILSSIRKGWIGIVLQILFIPMILTAWDRFSSRHE